MTLQKISIGLATLLFTGLPALAEIDLSGSYLHWDWQCVDPQVVPTPVPGATGCSSDPAVINQLSGNPIGFIQKQGHVGIQYEFHLGNGSTLTPRFDAAYQGPQNGTNNTPVAGSPSDVYGRVGGFTVANARLIWIFEKLGWVREVRWPTPRRLARLTEGRPGQEVRGS